MCGAVDSTGKPMEKEKKEYMYRMPKRRAKVFTCRMGRAIKRTQAWDRDPSDRLGVVVVVVGCGKALWLPYILWRYGQARVTLPCHF